MIETLPLWFSVPTVIILSLTALYKCYIAPKD